MVNMLKSINRYGIWFNGGLLGVFLVRVTLTSVYLIFEYVRYGTEACMK